MKNESHIQGFRKEIDQAIEVSKEKFITWFNGGADEESAFIQGAWDFTLHIGEAIAQYIKNPEEKTILEIGHGGGRILSSAARHFKQAYGCDIHHQNLLVKELLEKRGIHNVELFQGSGSDIPLPNQSIDVVYSFIVIQHMEKKEIVEKYIEEIHRILRDQGIAILYFGRNAKNSFNTPSKLRYYLDCFLELWQNECTEKEVKVNDINILFTFKGFSKICQKYGFKIKGRRVSHRKVPTGLKLYGSQHGIIISK